MATGLLHFKAFDCYITILLSSEHAWRRILKWCDPWIFYDISFGLVIEATLHFWSLKLEQFSTPVSTPVKRYYIYVWYSLSPRTFWLAAPLLYPRLGSWLTLSQAPNGLTAILNNILTIYFAHLYTVTQVIWSSNWRTHAVNWIKKWRPLVEVGYKKGWNASHH